MYKNQPTEELADTSMQATTRYVQAHKEVQVHRLDRGTFLSCWSTGETIHQAVTNFTQEQHIKYHSCQCSFDYRLHLMNLHIRGTVENPIYLCISPNGEVWIYDDTVPDVGVLSPVRPTSYAPVNLFPKRGCHHHPGLSLSRSSTIPTTHLIPLEHVNYLCSVTKLPSYLIIQGMLGSLYQWNLDNPILFNCNELCSLVPARIYAVPVLVYPDWHFAYIYNDILWMITMNPDDPSFGYKVELYHPYSKSHLSDQMNHFVDQYRDCPRLLDSAITHGIIPSYPKTKPTFERDNLFVVPAGVLYGQVMKDCPWHQGIANLFYVPSFKGKIGKLPKHFLHCIKTQPMLQFAIFIGAEGNILIFDHTLPVNCVELPFLSPACASIPLLPHPWCLHPAMKKSTLSPLANDYVIPWCAIHSRVIGRQQSIAHAIRDLLKLHTLSGDNSQVYPTVKEMSESDLYVPVRYYRKSGHYLFIKDGLLWLADVGTNPMVQLLYLHDPLWNANVRIDIVQFVGHMSTLNMKKNVMAVLQIPLELNRPS